MITFFLNPISKVYKQEPWVTLKASRDTNRYKDISIDRETQRLNGSTEIQKEVYIWSSVGLDSKSLELQNQSSYKAKTLKEVKTNL